jgi:hypothetical protein
MPAPRHALRLFVSSNIAEHEFGSATLRLISAHLWPPDREEDLDEAFVKGLELLRYSFRPPE